MKYRVRHTTRYAYRRPVDLASHMLHLLPRPLPWQEVISDALAIEPAPGRRVDASDAFGNRTTWLFLDQPHLAFEVTSEAVVAVRCPDPPEDAATPPWEAIAASARQGGAEGAAAAEFTFPSRMAPASPTATAYAATSFPAGRPVLAGLRDLNQRIFREFTFRAGVTTLATPVSEVMHRREGVCQDFTHVMLSALRGLGLPARYTSGYIRTRPPPGRERRRGADQSHAWVGAWMGPAHGWVQLDPTNGVVVRDEHVVLAWGRDYGDISPLRGVILGGGAHSLQVSVDLDPL
ncbi:MAG TPA: transglutaminase family protein [Acetobacteraceae bacterium]|nr:transglutaminase family protein [Acetobacteraceae bacterium]